MDELRFLRVFTVVKLVLKARGAEVALSEEVDLHVLVDEDPDTDVEFAPVHQEGPFDVLLDDEGEVLLDVDLILGTDAATVSTGCGRVSCSAGLSLYRIIVLIEYCPELLDAFEDMDSNSAVLVRGFQNPIVTANEVTLRHYQARGVLSQKHLPDVGTVNLCLLRQIILNISKAPRSLAHARLVQHTCLADLNGSCLRLTQYLVTS